MIPNTSLEMMFNLFVLWAVLFICWRNYRADRLRDELFALRNQLFDYAATGGVAFEAPAYQILRTTMNGLIRRAEHVSFSRYLIVSAGESRSAEHLLELASQRWQLAVSHLTPDQRKEILEVNHHLNLAMVRSLVAGSPLLWVFALIGKVMELLQQFKASRLISGRLERQANVIEAQAYCAQEVDMGAAA